MLPINEEVNCERILSTHKYQTSNHKDLEEIWLIKYLRNKKKSKKEIYKIWLNLYLHKTLKEKDDDAPELRFKTKWSLSSNIVFHNNTTIKIPPPASEAWDLAEFHGSTAILAWGSP